MDPLTIFTYGCPPSSTSYTFHGTGYSLCKNMNELKINLIYYKKNLIFFFFKKNPQHSSLYNPYHHNIDATIVEFWQNTPTTLNVQNLANRGILA